MANIARAPLRTWVPRPDPAVALRVACMGLGCAAALLAPKQGALPHNQYDWPNPIAARPWWGTTVYGGQRIIRTPIAAALAEAGAGAEATSSGLTVRTAEAGAATDALGLSIVYAGPVTEAGAGADTVYLGGTGTFAAREAVAAADALGTLAALTLGAAEAADAQDSPGALGFAQVIPGAYASVQINYPANIAALHSQAWVGWSAYPATAWATRLQGVGEGAHAQDALGVILSITLQGAEYAVPFDWVVGVASWPVGVDETGAAAAVDAPAATLLTPQAEREATPALDQVVGNAGLPVATTEAGAAADVAGGISLRLGVGAEAAAAVDAPGALVNKVIVETGRAADVTARALNTPAAVAERASDQDKTNSSSPANAADQAYARDATAAGIGSRRGQAEAAAAVDASGRIYGQPGVWRDALTAVAAAGAHVNRIAALSELCAPRDKPYLTQKYVVVRAERGAMQSRQVFFTPNVVRATEKARAHERAHAGVGPSGLDAAGYLQPDSSNPLV